MGIYIINLNENSKETADGHIYNFGHFRKFWTQMAIYFYPAGEVSKDPWLAPTPSVMSFWKISHLDSENVTIVNFCSRSKLCWIVVDIQYSFCLLAQLHEILSFQ